MFLDLPPVPPVVIEESCSVDFKAYISQYDDLASKTKANSDEAKSEARAERRKTAIIKEALIVGAQAGHQRRSIEIRELLDHPKATKVLNAFSFRPLMYRSNIVPPVITEVGPSVSIDGDGQSATSTRRSWRIIRPAYIRTGALSWESYLLDSASTNVRARGIYNFYAPKSAADRKVWKDNYCRGFSSGFDTANAEFTQNLNRFMRDYIGMIRFKRLEQSGVVSAPEYKETRVGIVVNDKWTQVDQRDLRIVVESKFNADADWDNKYIKSD